MTDPLNTLRVLIVGSASLHRRVRDLVEISEYAVSVIGRDAAMSRLAQGPFDIVLLKVRESLFSTLSIAAGMRCIERRAPTLRHAAIIACTSNLRDYEDAVCSGSGLSGALEAPWSRATVHACLDRWRDGKYLRELRSEQPGERVRGDRRL